MALSRKLSFPALAGVSLLITLVSCTTTDLYEKTASIPGHAWASSFKPTFTFTIRDTTALYAPYLVLRHTDRYNYNNIWLTIHVTTPGSDSAISVRVDKRLATNEEGWLGSGMDDIYEHRVKLVEEFVTNGVSFRKPGDYIFTIEQIMRENPLLHVLNVGLRVEKQE